MIPAPYHFRGIDREACLHPDVAAEIEAARRRAGPSDRRRWHGVLARLRPAPQAPRQTPACVPAE